MRYEFTVPYDPKTDEEEYTFDLVTTDWQFQKEMQININGRLLYISNVRPILTNPSTMAPYIRYIQVFCMNI